jgi:copper(I)-binding protein
MVLQAGVNTRQASNPYQLRLSMNLNRTLAIIASFIISSTCMAHDYNAGNLHVIHPVARASIPGQNSAAAYLSIENKGKEADRLISVSTPLAQSAQMHTMSQVGNLMKMREVDSIEIKPASAIKMQPGQGYHLMLLGLKQPLRYGDKLPLTLTFEKAGKLDVTVFVEDIKPANAKADKAEAHNHK